MNCGGSAESSADGADGGTSALAGSVAVLAGSAGASSDSGGSSTEGNALPGGAGGTSSDAGASAAQPFCAKPLSDCSSSDLLPSIGLETSYCSLSKGLTAICNPCGAGVTGCLVGTGIVRGTKYTYLDISRVDVGSRLVYDASDSLVAVLGFGANSTPQWRCVAGPEDFDPTEAMANPMAATLGTLRETCAAEGP